MVESTRLCGGTGLTVRGKGLCASSRLGKTLIFTSKCWGHSTQEQQQAAGGAGGGVGGILPPTAPQPMDKEIEPELLAVEPELLAVAQCIPPLWLVIEWKRPTSVLRVFATRRSCQPTPERASGMQRWIVVKKPRVKPWSAVGETCRNTATWLSAISIHIITSKFIEAAHHFKNRFWTTLLSIQASTAHALLRVPKYLNLSPQG